MQTEGVVERMTERDNKTRRAQTSSIKHQSNIIFASPVAVNRQTLLNSCEKGGIYPHHVLSVKEKKAVLPSVSSLISSDKYILKFISLTFTGTPVGFERIHCLTLEIDNR